MPLHREMRHLFSPRQAPSLPPPSSEPRPVRTTTRQIGLEEACRQSEHTSRSQLLSPNKTINVLRESVR